MADTSNSKYVFVDTKQSWWVGTFHHTLSFSSDGTTVAGSTDVDTPDFPKGYVQFWESNGTPISSSEGWTSVTFSTTEPDLAVVLGEKGIQLMKRDPSAGTWNPAGPSNSSFEPVPPEAAFSPDGKSVTFVYAKQTLYQYTTGPTFQFARYLNSSSDSIWSFAHHPLDPDAVVLGFGNGAVEVRAFTGKYASALLSSPSATGSVGVTTCAWSQDGDWIATGDSYGDVRLWSAGVTTDVSLARTLRAPRPGSVSSILFTPDSGGLIILAGGYPRMWDITQGRFVPDSGLPTTARNIALDGPRSRVAVVVDDRIALYELRVSSD